MLAERKQNQPWVEPFVGGANMIDKVDGVRIGGDSNAYLIDMWCQLQKGWVPPSFVSEDEWRKVKEEMDASYEKYYIAFVRLGCSFGADWNGGYARNVRKDKPNAEELNRTTKSYCGQSQRNLLKQVPKLDGVDFFCRKYNELKIPPMSLIYCDPPYEGTTKYKDDFDHAKFWQWCRDMSSAGHTVFISEYNAPSDFKCVWEQEINNTLNNTAKTSKAVERLFTV